MEAFITLTYTMFRIEYKLPDLFKKKKKGKYKSQPGEKISLLELP